MPHALSQLGAAGLARQYGSEAILGKTSVESPGLGALPTTFSALKYDEQSQETTLDDPEYLHPALRVSAGAPGGQIGALCHQMLQPTDVGAARVELD